MKTQIPLLAMLVFLLGACAVQEPSFTQESCSSSFTKAAIDNGSNTIQVSGGGVLGQHVRMNETLRIKRVMLRLSSSGVTSMILSITDELDANEQGTTVSPKHSFTISQPFGTAQITNQWFTLPETVVLERGRSYLIGFAPNSPMNVVYGDSPDEFRGTYRTGNAPSQWADAHQERALSFGFEAENDCRLSGGYQ